jgi:2-amino-4-hydroxy-6-hydroxymethyldihydropteridine diphosphokinase
LKRHLSAQHLVLGLGSNEQQEAYFRQALDALKSHFGDLTISSVYQSLPIDYLQSKNNARSVSSVNESGLSYYYNAVVVVQTELSIEQIKNITRDVEQQCGRDRTKSTAVDAANKNNEIVTMDIDCLLYGERTSQSKNMYLPHENILTMAYVLRPLAELLPEIFYIKSNKTFAELWCEMASQHDVLLEPVDFIWQNDVVSIAPSCLAL